MSVLLPADTAGRAERLRRDLAAATGCARDAVRVVRAPYRICPLGAHVDHQFGPVCALGLEHAVLLAWVARDDAVLSLTSHDFAGTVEVPLDRAPSRAGDWGDHARGAVAALAQEAGLAGGFHAVVDGAFGESGLSSSAAVGVAYLLALAERNGVALAGEGLVRAQGRIEQGFLGLANGLLDPAAVVLAEEDALVRIDTRTLAHRTVRRGAGAEVCFLAVSSGQREALVSGGRFNERVAECREAARLIAERSGSLAAAGEEADGAASGAADSEAHDEARGAERLPRLGDLPREAVAEHLPALPGPLGRRARHFLTETARVDSALDAWARGDFGAFGDAMRASARSSIDDYETGSPAMVDLLEVLGALPGVYGARFSGAGYRGCCVALVTAAAAEEIAAEALERYGALHPELAARGFALASGPAAGAGAL